MRNAIPVFLLAMVLAAPAIADEATPTLPFHLPAPEGWFTETIPFPLGFAPDLAYEGLEELRFAPSWSKADSEELWAYTFVWWLPADTPLGAERLEKDLSAYYEGLMVTVAQGKDFDLSEATFSTQLAAPAPDEDQEPYLVGKTQTFDSFVTGEMMNLNVKIYQLGCREQGRIALMFQLSPQPDGHGIWREFEAIRQGFRCEPRPSREIR